MRKWSQREDIGGAIFTAAPLLILLHDAYLLCNGNTPHGKVDFVSRQLPDSSPCVTRIFPMISEEQMRHRRQSSAGAVVV